MFNIHLYKNSNVEKTRNMLSVIRMSEKKENNLLALGLIGRT